MEATSARMAVRHQFEGFPPPRTQLQRFIYNACDPMSNLEPNLALNLEIVDLINSKKGNAPREAAVQIVQLVNHRNPNVSLLALSLLDNCVKNCGYPFHLQISTKEFLNELVRRFPERPPLRASRVQSRILEAIEEWRATICQTSRYKEDLGFIRDMHRLLLYKGYMFPEVRRDDAAVLNDSENLRSAEEMEEEERAAQSAKLQELIRRGTPQDLQEANKLMKVMAGYDTRNKTDYRAKAAEEVSRVQQKAKILEEMLQGMKEGDKMQEGDVFEELANALQSAHPKIQRMCEEESDDAEAVNKLLVINDSIHRTIQRYKLMKAGNIQEANKIEKGTLGTTTGVGRNAANELSLIDFDLEPTTTPTQATSSTNPVSNGSLLDDMTASANSSQQNTIEDDLLGLSMGGPPASGGISLGGATNLSFFNTGATSSVPPQPAQVPMSAAFASNPIQSPKPNYDAFASLSSALPKSKPATPSPAQQQKQPSSSLASSDPFAALVSSGSRPTSRPATPSMQQNGTRNTSSSFQPSGFASTQSSAVPAAATPASTDDDWNFVSALPEQTPTLPTKSSQVVHDNGKLRITLECMRQSSQATQPPGIFARVSFSNPTTSPISGLHFQIAVEKAYTLQLRPQTGKEVPANSTNSVTQDLQISNVPAGKGTAVKIRFKASYNWGVTPTDEQGMITNLGIA